MPVLREHLVETAVGNVATWTLFTVLRQKPKTFIYGDHLQTTKQCGSKQCKYDKVTQSVAECPNNSTQHKTIWMNHHSTICSMTNFLSVSHRVPQLEFKTEFSSTPALLIETRIVAKTCSQSGEVQHGRVRCRRLLIPHAIQMCYVHLGVPRMGVRVRIEMVMRNATERAAICCTRHEWAHHRSAKRHGTRASAEPSESLQRTSTTQDGLATELLSQ